MVDKLDVTHTGTAGVQALLAGIFRGDGNFKGNVDTSFMIWGSPPTIVAGATGQLTFSVGSFSRWSIPLLVHELNVQSAVEGKVEYDFNASLSILAGSQVYVRAF